MLRTGYGFESRREGLLLHVAQLVEQVKSDSYPLIQTPFFFLSPLFGDSTNDKGQDWQAW